MTQRHIFKLRQYLSWPELDETQRAQVTAEFPPVQEPWHYLYEVEPHSCRVTDRWRVTDEAAVKYNCN